MRILYGVQGTGNGHISRCRSLAVAMQRHGLKVDFLFSGRAAEGYFDMQAFGEYRAYSGLTFVSHDGQVDVWQTLRQNRPRQFWQDLQGLDFTGYDKVFSDFEPLTAWAAKRQKVPAIGISHQAAFAYDIPRAGEDLLSRTIMRHYAPVSTAIGLHWFHFGFPILPPIIDHIEPQQEDGSVLVYLPFESTRAIHELLSRFRGVEFRCFHPDIHEPHTAGNIHYAPQGREPFKLALARCSGVLSNAGFELASEALSLGKKLLLKPLQGQFEQRTNAMTLEMLGLAEVMESLDPGTVRSWLNSEALGCVAYPDVAEGIASWLASGSDEPMSQLIERMWRRVTFPEPVCDRLAELGMSESMGCALPLKA
ncbi:MAG: MJ1255/VC2487 family glycosyltransferase [Aeromonadaceae bacterium]